MILLISHMETIGKSLGTVPNDSMGHTGDCPY